LRQQPQTESSGLKARRLATYLLKAVLHDRQPFDEALASLSAKAAFASLEFRDRAFARAIAATALRRLGQIEDLLSRFLQKPLPAEAFAARFILIAGAAQLAFMEVAPHAAISLAVEQAKAFRAHRYAGLINAVLRKVSANAAAILAEQDAPALNTPAWLFARWEAHYGTDTARLIAAAHLEEPALDLSVKSDAAGWATRLGGELLPWGTVRLKHHKGRIEDIEGYAEGAWWVQDAAAALPALLLGDVSGKRVADLCAAPGGKTLELAARGAVVTAVDISASRLRRLQENLDRLHLQAEIVQADVAEWMPAEPFDAVLLDAPCSSTGTIRRNPDIPYLKTPADIAALSAVQARLLEHALSLIKPGGQLVYSTCSLEREEGEAQIERLLAARPDVSLLPIAAGELGVSPECVAAVPQKLPHPSPLPRRGEGAGCARCEGVPSPLVGEGQGEGAPLAVCAAKSSAGYLRTLPFHAGGMDGFFAARLALCS
jgi:16S rRNA (cytosine967-C5)-methyltransferase